jgi:GNAT superfamily N-acetyltransferase
MPDTPTPEWRPLRPSEAADAARLVRTSFPQHLTDYLPYCQPGAGRYFADVASGRRPPAPHQRLLAVTSADEVIGFVDLRVGETVFLSYVVLTETARGHGLGRALLERLLRELGDRPWELDVFDYNTPARRLYESLGFRETAVSTWRTAPLSPTGPLPDVRWPELEESAARLSTYGFTMMTADVGGRAVTVGLPSSRAARGVPGDDRQAALLRDLARRVGSLRTELRALDEAATWGTPVARVHRLRHPGAGRR